MSYTQLVVTKYGGGGVRLYVIFSFPSLLTTGESGDVNYWVTLKTKGKDSGTLVSEILE